MIGFRSGVSHHRRRHASQQRAWRLLSREYGVLKHPAEQAMRNTMPWPLVLLTILTLALIATLSPMSIRGHPCYALDHYPTMAATIPSILRRPPLLGVRGVIPRDTDYAVQISHRY